MRVEIETTRFDELGYAGPFRAMEPDVARRVGERLVTEVITRRSSVYATGEADIPKLDFVRDRHLDSPLLARVCTDASILETVVALAGPDVLLWRSDLFVQGKSDKPTLPHQDKAFSGVRGNPGIGVEDGTMPRNVTVWLTFSEVSPERGGLFLAPRTHLEGVLPERPQAGGIFGKGRELARDFAPSEILDMQMGPGEFVVFDNLLVHGSHPNVTDSQRIAISIRFVPTSVVVDPHRSGSNAHGQRLDNYGAVLVSGHDTTRRNPLRALPTGRGAATLQDEVAYAEIPAARRSG